MWKCTYYKTRSRFLWKNEHFSVKSTVLLTKIHDTLLKSWFHAKFWVWSRFFSTFLCTLSQYGTVIYSHIFLAKINFSFYHTAVYCCQFDGKIAETQNNFYQFDEFFREIKRKCSKLNWWHFSYQLWLWVDFLFSNL